MSLRFLSFSVLALFCNLIFGKEFNYPEIPSEGNTLNDFIPTDWHVFSSAFGDLNNDSTPDFAIVIQHCDSVKIPKNEDGVIDSVITQPRILLVAFYNPQTQLFDLKEVSNSFVLNHDNPDMEDPFQEIKITNGMLYFGFKIFMNTGSWGIYNNTYSFLYENDNFVLVKASYKYQNRALGDTEEHHYNFETKDIKTIFGNIASEKQSVKIRKIKTEEMRTLRNMLQPFSWQVEKDLYL